MHRNFIIFVLAIAATTSVQANLVQPLNLGQNTFDFTISGTNADSFNRGLPVFPSGSTQWKIDWIDLDISVHTDSSVGNTDIQYSIDDSPAIDVFGSVSDVGTYRIFDGPYTDLNSRIDFAIIHTGETLDASTSGQWRVFVSEVPEPSSFALLSLGGLALMRRRSRIA